MFRNYLITALRTIVRQKGFSLINIMGLAVGLACALLILLWVQDELSYDRFQEHAGRLYQVEENQFYSGEVYHVTVTPYPSGPVWKEEIPEIEDACRYQWPSGMLFTRGEKSFYEGGCVAVDSSFFNMFTFPLLKGDPATVLTEP
jgi:putative ABC transport system permease protein